MLEVNATPPADLRFSVTSAAVRSLLRYGRTRGVAADDWLAEFALDDDALDDIDVRVSQRAYNALFERLAERTGDDAFGLHFAETEDLDGFHVVGHLAARAITLGLALEHVARFSRIVHDAGSVEVELTDAGLVIHPGCRGMLHEFPRHVAEFASASVVVHASKMTGRRVVPLAVELRHDAPERLRDHRRIFGVTPRFSRPETKVVLPREAAALPIPSAQAGLASLLERFAEDIAKQLAARSEQDLVGRIEQAIATSLEDGKPDLDTLARSLGVGSRTLQRRLDGLETSFQELVDSTRRACAERYIRDRRLTLQEIGYLLGYSDVSNFFRAFRRWFHTTPAEYRRRACETRGSADGL